jgi:hypothetical protein
MNDIGYIFCFPIFPQYLRHQSLQSKVFGISRDILGYLHLKKNISNLSPQLGVWRTFVHITSEKKKTSTSNSPWDWGGSLFSHKPDCFYHHVAVKIVIQTGWRLWSRASRNIRFSPMGIAYNGIFLRCLQSHLVDINMSLKNPVARIRCLKKDSFTHFASVNLVWM